MDAPPLFSVFTPTYNRAHTLGVVHAALVAQTDRDFEWLVVDDGSTDGTAALVRAWARDASFPIRYFAQPNGGKHRAFNRGVTEARGTLFVPLDSDDGCRPDALARFRALWLDIPEAARERYSGITVLCAGPDGRVLGRPFPADVVDARPAELMAAGAYVGDKWGFHRTDVLRRFPFPEYDGERFVPESVVWNRIGREYLMRFVNEVLQEKTYHDDGLTRQSVATRARSPLGTSLAYRELLAGPLPAGYRWRTLVNYVRFMRHARRPWLEIIAGSGHPAAACLAAPLGALASLVDRRRLGDGVRARAS